MISSCCYCCLPQAASHELDSDIPNDSNSDPNLTAAQHAAATAATSDGVLVEPGTPLRTGGGADDEDDFMVVKHRHVPPDEQLQLESAGQDAAAEMQEQRPKKRIRMKIKAGRASGSRLVFDDQGGAQAPLAMLGHDRQVEHHIAG